MNSFHKISISVVLSVGLFAGGVSAQLGDDNPTGTSGQSATLVTTGCGYSAYTGNATRSVTDLVVAGGVGAYPFAFTRTMNSRYTAGTPGAPTPFGKAGNWNHSFGWAIDSVTVIKQGAVGRPISYNVYYPDGRRVIFSSRSGDTKFRGPPGVRDRFDQLSTQSPNDCYLILPDGGKIHFLGTATTTTSGSGSNATYTSVYKFTFKDVIDPYGQVTTITYATDGNSMTVTEPARRTIQIFYRAISSQSEGFVGDKVIDRIVGSDSRTVKYNYGAYVTTNGIRYTSLTSVRYFNDASYDAMYTYQDDNKTQSGRPLIQTCIDPMFDGPMWRIAYDFAPSATALVSGQLLREKHFGGTPVSTLSITGTGNPSYRKETRGDNPTNTGNPYRTFTYNTYLLKETTDFQGVKELTGYDSMRYLESVTDRRGNVTTYRSDQLNGNINLITQPISGDVIPANTPTRIQYKYGNPGAADPNNRSSNNPYYLASIEDGNGNVSQQFFRFAATMQISQINYAPATYDYSEYFTYNQFGQVLTHQTRRGFTESYEYDPVNPSRVLAYRDTEHATGNPTARYHYDSFGRVDYMTEGRGASLGDATYTTNFEYNMRGQLTRLIHPPDGNGNRTYIQYAYNPNGTLAWTADERHPGGINDPTQRTSYLYDDYKRLRTVTTPLRVAGDSTARTTQYFYDQNGTGDDYRRTAATPTKIVSPGGKVTTIAYDENLRTSIVTVAGDANVPDAKTSYTYDPNGNVLTVKDPNGQNTGALTTYYYDKQNRVSAIDDPITADRNSSGRTMYFRYDVAGNRIKEFRADDKVKQYWYDAVGRCKVIDDYGSTADLATGAPGTIVNEISFGHDAEDNVIWQYVPNEIGGSKIYDFTYDKLNRKSGASYPIDYSGTTRRSETYEYDVANHLWKYTNPAGQTKTLIYDNRGRLTDTSWTNDPAKGATGPAVHINYDSTRPTGITTNAYTVAGITLPATTIGFGYDEANNRTYEDQTISGLPTRRVQTDPDADGSRKNLLVKTGNTIYFANNFEYTNRNELRNINNGASGNAQPLFTYSYDASGNVTQRLGRTLSGDSTATLYDALNRAYQCTHAANGTNFSVSNYDYTKIGNLNDVIRGASAYENVNGDGDYFTAYNTTNELTGARYSATGPTDNNAAKKVTYSVLSKIRDSVTVTDNTVTPATTTTTNYVHNDLNQYTKITVNGVDRFLQYDTNFNLTSYNGWSYRYDAENRLISVSGGHSGSFAYDAVGRCVKRVIDGSTTVLTYDQWTPIVEWDGSGNLVATNIYGLGDDEILYRSSGSTQWYYKSDPMGNVRFLLNATGIIIEKYIYDAFGSATVTNFNGSGRTTNRFMFSGREYFSSLGLYDLRNRVYDPVMGRFYQTDPIGLAGDATNLYRFCGNNSLLGGDPTGLDGDDRDPIATLYYGIGGLGYSSQYEGFLNEIFTQNDDSIASYGNTTDAFIDLSGIGGYAWSPPRRGPSMPNNSGPVVSRGIGQPSLPASFLPLYGNGRSMIDYYQNGRWVMGSVFAAMTTVDVLSLGSDTLLIDVLKGGVRGVSKLATRGGVQASERGLALVESHLASFPADAGNVAMVRRLRSAFSSGQRLTGVDANFYLHEAAEATMMRRLMGEGMAFEDAYRIAHPATLQKFGLSPFSLYHPEVIRANPAIFSTEQKAFIGLGK